MDWKMPLCQRDEAYGTKNNQCSGRRMFELWDDGSTMKSIKNMKEE